MRIAQAEHRSRCALLIATLGLLACLAWLAPAEAARKKSKPCRVAAKGPEYHTPGYKGLCRAPKTGEQPVLPPIALGENGRSPQVLVDDAGTAHIVWNQDGGDAGPDLLRYCRLKRGAKGCDNPPAALAPDQPGPFNSPGVNDDIAGPRILAVSNGLIFLTHRYPNVVPKPDGTDSDRTTYMYTSDNGGQTITGPAIVGDAEPSGGAFSFGADASRIGLISDTRTGGTFFQVIDPGSYTSSQANLGGNGPDRAYSGSVISVGGGPPIAAYADLSGNTFIRQWSGAGNPGDPGTWSEAQTTGVDPRLAAGPAGAFLATAPTSRDKIQVRALNGIKPGGGPTINTGPYGARDFFQDSGGALRLGWVDRTGNAPELLQSVAESGRPFSGFSAVARAKEGIDDVDLGATADGGGFAVYTAGASSQGFGRIFASPYGDQALNKLPGIGGLPGGGIDPDTTTSCQEISYKAVQFQSKIGCFSPVAGKPGLKITSGAFKLNGLEIVPDAGVKVEVSTSSGAKTIDSVGGNGQVTVQLRTGSGPIVLWHGELHIKLPTGAAGTKLFSVDIAQFAPKIKGFPVAGDFDLILKQHSIEIPVQLKLPKVFGGLTGSATLKADNDNGLSVDSVRFVVPKFVLGPLELSRIIVEWNGSTDTWTGGAGVKFLGAGMSASLTFKGGTFHEGSVSISPVPFPGMKLAPDVFLNEVSAKLHLADDTTWFEGGALFGVQPIAPPDSYLYTVKGTLRATITPKFAMDYRGDGAISGIPVSSATAHGDIDGYFSGTGAVKWDIEAVSGTGTFDGYFDAASGNFGGKIDSTVTVGKCLFCVDIGVSALISNDMVAGCYKPLAGFSYKLKTREVDFSVGSCPGEPLNPAWCADQPNLERVQECLAALKSKPAAAKAAAVGPPNFTLPGGLASASVEVIGVAGPPSFTLISPAGAPVPLVPVNDPAAANANTPAVYSNTDTSVTIGLRKPAGGNWKIQEAAPGSVAVVDVARELRTTVSAKVRGRGRKRVLSYKATRRKGLTVRFVERIGRGGRQIRVVKAGSGRFSFVPGDGPGGKREIVANAEQDGFPVLQETVATYRAPGPIRPHVRGLKVRRAGSKVVARWRRAPGAKSYIVRFDVSDGRHLLRTTSRKKAQLGGIGRRDRVRVRVYGRSAHDRLGKPARAQLRNKRR